MTLLRARRFLKSLPSRIVGSHIATQSETVARLSTKAHFVSDAELEARVKAARALMGDEIYVKPDRKLIQDDDFPPVDFERLPP